MLRASVMFVRQLQFMTGFGKYQSAFLEERHWLNPNFFDICFLLHFDEKSAHKILYLSHSRSCLTDSAKLTLYDTPMQQFSQLLEQRVVDYFKRKYGLEISPATAQEYLNSFAELFLTCAQVNERERPVQPTL